MRKIIIAIDGYSSCGKSTLAKRLASEFDYLYIDSGAMYRAITLYFLRNHIDWTQAAQVQEALQNIELDFVLNPETGQSEILLNDENVEFVIRDMVVAEKVSEVAAIKEVREYAVSRQQKLGSNKGIVMDGRDIGTTVFPDAELKLFLVADNQVRVQRRFKELFRKNPYITVEEVTNNLAMRDYIDSNREISPLKRADDAILMDNTDLTKDEFFAAALKIVNEKVGDS